VTKTFAFTITQFAEKWVLGRITENSGQKTALNSSDPKAATYKSAHRPKSEKLPDLLVSF